MYKSLHLRFAADALTLTTIKVLLHCPTTFTVISVFNMQRRVLWNCWCYETSYSVEKMYIHSLIHSWSGRIVSIYFNVNPLNDILQIFTYFSRKRYLYFYSFYSFHHYSPQYQLYGLRYFWCEWIVPIFSNVDPMIWQIFTRFEESTHLNFSNIILSI